MDLAGFSATPFDLHPLHPQPPPGTRTLLDSLPLFPYLSPPLAVAPLGPKPGLPYSLVPFRSSPSRVQPSVVLDTIDRAAQSRTGRMFEMDEDIAEEVRVVNPSCTDAA